MWDIELMLMEQSSTSQIDGSPSLEKRDYRNVAQGVSAENPTFREDLSGLDFGMTWLFQLRWKWELGTVRYKRT
jgi:hypothetical protein